jgi:hypothetical protein
MARPKRQPLRQGDVLLVPIAPSRIPAGHVVPRDGGRIVLAYGEVTGHAHAIESATAVLTETDTERRFLQIMERAFLRHEEHGTITLEPGAYEVRRQREWTDADEPRQVAD